MVHLTAKRNDRCAANHFQWPPQSVRTNCPRDHALFKCDIKIQLCTNDDVLALCYRMIESATWLCCAREPHSLYNFNAVPPAVIWLLKVAGCSCKVRSTCALLWAHILSRILLHQTIGIDDMYLYCLVGTYMTEKCISRIPGFFV